MSKEDVLLFGTYGMRGTGKSYYEKLKEKDKEIERLNNIINELERRFNQELENNEKYDIEDTKEFYSKKWVRDTLNDFINMIKELKGSDKE